MKERFKAELENTHDMSQTARLPTIETPKSYDLIQMMSQLNKQVHPTKFLSQITTDINSESSEDFYSEPPFIQSTAS